MATAIHIAPGIEVLDEELEWQAIRAQGAGGQHVNKTSSAVTLKFDIHASTLKPAVRERLLSMSDRRITSDGMVVIKAQNARSQLANKRAAIERLTELLQQAAKAPTPRIKTRPRAGAVRRRLNDKRKRGKTKQLRDRGSIRTDD